MRPSCTSGHQALRTHVPHHIQQRRNGVEVPMCYYSHILVWIKIYFQKAMTILLLLENSRTSNPNPQGLTGSWLRCLRSPNYMTSSSYFLFYLLSLQPVAACSFGTASLWGQIPGSPTSDPCLGIYQEVSTSGAFNLFLAWPSEKHIILQSRPCPYSLSHTHTHPP